MKYGRPMVASIQRCDVCGLRQSIIHGIPVHALLRTCRTCALSLVELERSTHLVTLEAATLEAFDFTPRMFAQLSIGAQRFYLRETALTRLLAHR